MTTHDHTAAPTAAPASAAAPAPRAGAPEPRHGEPGARDRLAAVAALGRLVGVDLADRVAFDGAAGAHGARGLVRDGRVHLDAGWRDDAAGRRVVLHEALHLRQLAGATAATTDARARRQAAEHEAQAATERVLAGHAPPPLVAGLRADDLAFDDGAGRTATTGSREQDAPSETETPDDRLVRHRVSRQIARDDHTVLFRIVRHLVGEDRLADDDVDSAVALLDDQPLAVAAGVVAAQQDAHRVRLLGALGDEHRRAHRHGVLAVLLGQRAGQLSRLEADDLATLDLVGLEPDEHAAMVDVLRTLAPPVLLELLEDAPNRASVRRLVEEPVPGPRPAPPTTVDGVVDLVREDVRTVSRTGSVRALDRLTRFLRDTPARTATDGDGRESPPPPAPPSPSPLAQVADALAADGTLTRLLDGIGAGRDGLSRDAVAVLDTLAQLHTAPDPDHLAAVADRVRSLLSRDFTDWAVTDSDAQQALPLVLRIARTDGSLLRRLDAEGRVDTLFDELPDQVLYRADVRGQTDEIMRARREEVLSERAAEKLSRSFFDWAVTARDAYLASRMYAAMSPRAQQAFAELEGGDLLERMNDEMTASMRHARDRHGLSAGAAQLHREEARRLLADPETWSGDRVETLRSLVLVAVTTGLGAWVFDRSRAYAAHRDERVRRRVVAPFRLYEPDVREEYEPTRLEGTAWYQEGVFEYLPMVGLLLQQAPIIGPLFGRDYALARDEATGGDRLEVDLEAIATALGGDLGGARFRTDEDAAADDAGAGRARTRRVPGTNHVTVALEEQEHGGLVHVAAPAIDLDSYRSVGPDGVVSFGRLQLTELDVRFSYTDDQPRRPAGVQVRTGPVSVADLLYGQGDTLAAAALLTLTSLGVRGGSGAPRAVAAARPEDSGLWQFLLAGLDYMTSDVWTQRASALTSFEVALGDLEVTGLLVGGQRIERLRATDLHLGYGADQLSYLQVRERSLERRRDRARGDAQAVTAIDEQLADVRAQLRERRATEDERQQLEQRFRRDPGAMTRTERDRLRRLRGGGGAVLDAGAVTVAGVAGAAEVGGEVTLSGVHGEAGFGGRGPSVTTDAARVQEFLDVGPPGLHDLDRPHVRLHVDRAAFSGLRLPGEVPDADELRELRDEVEEQLEDAEGRAQGALLDRLAALKRALEVELPRYRALEQRAAATRWGTGGPPSTSRYQPLGPGEERMRAQLRASLQALTATKVQSGRLEHLEVTADLAGTVTEVAARAADLEQVERGGLSVERVTGTGIEAKIHTDQPGHEGRTSLPDSLTRAEVAAATLGLTGVRSNGQRLVEDVHLTGVEADVSPFDGGWEIHALHLNTLAVTGLRVVSRDRVVTTFPDDPALDADPEQRAATPEPTGGGTVELGDLDLSAQLRTDERGGLTGVTVRSLVIGAVRMPEPLRYRDGERDLTLTAEQVTGIEARDLEVPLADGIVPVPTAGTVRVSELDQLQVAGRLTAALRAGFTLDGPPPSGSTLELSFTEDGVELGHLDLPRLEVADLVFDDGERRLELGGPAVLEGITARASVGLDRGVDEEGEGTLAPGTIWVPRLDVRLITAPHVRFQQGATVLEAAGGYDAAVPTVERLRVRGLRLGEDLSFGGVAVHVQRARVGIAGDFTEGISGGVEADVNDLELHLGAGFEEVSGALGTSQVRGRVAFDDGTVLGGDLSGLGVGAVSWDAPTRTLRFGASGPEGDVDGITVERLEVGPVELATGDLEVELGSARTSPASQEVELGSADTRPAILEGVELAARISFEEADDGGVDWEHFRAELDRVHADRLEVDDLTLRFPSSGLVLRVPAGLPATAAPLDLVPNDGEALVVERRWDTDETTTVFQGRLEVMRAVVPELRASIGSRLQADTRLELDDLKLGRLAAGDVELHLGELRALDANLTNADLAAFGVGAFAPGGSSGLDLNALFAQVESALLPWRDVAEHADGHVRGDLTIAGVTTGLDATISSGRISLPRLERGLATTVVGAGAAIAIEFDFEPPGMVLELNTSLLEPAVRALPGGSLLPPGALERTEPDVLQWTMGPTEQAATQGTMSIPLVDFFGGRMPAWMNAELLARTTGPSTEAAAFQLSNLQVALDVRTPRPIRVSLPPRPGPGGPGIRAFETVVPANALTRLRAHGDVPGPGGLLELHLAQLQLGRTELAVSGVSGGDLDVEMDRVVVRRLDATADFAGGVVGSGQSAMAPTGLRGHLDELVATGVDVRWTPGGGGSGSGSGGTP